MILDTHAHLTDEAFSDIDTYLDLASAAGVRGILTIATTAEDSRQCIELAERFEQIRAAVGIHPNTCCQAAPGDWEVIVELCKHTRVIALGETGLDRYWGDCPWNTQLEFFERHVSLSRETGLPVVIHTRQCAEECLEFLQLQTREGAFPGVMHSYTGPADVAKACLELGLYISFAGMLTFKNAQEIRDVAQQLPMDRILVETDSPYLTPHPFRGKRPNHPALVVHTLDVLAGLHGCSRRQLAEITTENAKRLFDRWN